MVLFLQQKLVLKQMVLCNLLMLESDVSRPVHKKPKRTVFTDTLSAKEKLELLPSISEIRKCLSKFF